MSLNNYKNEEGFVVLLLILVISTVTLLIGYSAMVLGLRELDMGYSSSESSNALALAEGCVDETLRQLNFNSSYTGGTLSFGDDSCIITVVDSSGDKIITVTGQIGNYYKKVEVNATVSTTPYIINSWEEKS